MKKIILVVILVVLGVVVAMYFLPKTIEPNSVSINEVNVSDKDIIINADLTNSAVKYKKYTSEIKGNNLFINLKGGIFGNSGGRIVIELENNNYDEIYIQGKEEHKRIWSK